MKQFFPSELKCVFLIRVLNKEKFNEISTETFVNPEEISTNTKAKSISEITKNDNFNKFPFSKITRETLVPAATATTKKY